MDKVLTGRKEKLMSFMKNYKIYLIYIALILIIWYGFSIRSQNIDALKDATTGKYITSELDSTLFLRYAQYIAEHGSLFKVDPDRFYPLGADLTATGVFTSYFVAYLWKFLHVFNPALAVEYVDIIYPIIAMIILSIFMFLLMKKLFDWRVGLLSALFINILPSFIARSSVGNTDHDILAVMLMIMAFYFYFISTKTDKMWKAISLAVFAGVITLIARETAGDANFILFIIGMFTIVKIFFDKFTKKDYYTYLAWILPFIFYWHFFTNYGIKPFLFAVTSFTAFAALALATIYMLLFEFKTVKLNEKISNSMPKGVTALITTLLIGIVALYFIFGLQFFIDRFSEIYNHLFKAYSQTRWSLTVAENKKPFVVDWMSQMGKLYVYFFIFGSIALFYNTVKKLKAAWKLTIIYILFIFGYVFSRYSSNTSLNGDTGLAHFMFYGSIFLFFGTLIYGYLRTFYKDKNLFKDIEDNLNLDYAFVFVWFFVKIIAATSAVRLLFEFSLVTAPLAAFFVVFAFDYFMTLSNKALKYSLIFILVFLLISPFSFSKGIITLQAESSASQSQYTYSEYNQQWQQAGKWVRGNTPKDAVFAHWWDYGYWVQSGFERATVTDGGNFFIYWNYLSGRHLLTAQNSTEALEFMRAHNATYLLMVSNEIEKYGAYSNIGSDENFDRFSSIGIFNFDPKQTQAVKNETLIVFTGGIALDEDFNYQGTLLPARSTGVIGFVVHFGNVSYNGSIFLGMFNKVEAALYSQGQQYLVPLKCVYFDDKFFNFIGDDLMNACLRIIPNYDKSGKKNPLGAAIFVSPKVYKTLFGQLYLLNQDWNGFKLAYDDSAKIPLVIYQGRLIGPLKIWKADTAGVAFKPEYLATQYPDIRLTLPN